VIEGSARLTDVNLWHWDTSGMGDSVIFCHRGSQSCRVWDHQRDAFVTAGYRVIAYSRRGHYRSEVSVSARRAGQMSVWGQWGADATCRRPSAKRLDVEKSVAFGGRIMSGLIEQVQCILLNAEESLGTTDGEETQNQSLSYSSATMRGFDTVVGILSCIVRHERCAPVGARCR
jgi:hypothetical protein